jgi:copper homeostasis protein
LDQLVGLGFRRVLPSGHQETAYNGAPLIAELIRRATGRIEILCGGGVNRFTVADIVVRTDCDQVHASLREARYDPSTRMRPDIAFSAPVKTSEGRHDSTNALAVAELSAQLRALA